jgi:lysophospholipase L1-like esterase
MRAARSLSLLTALAVVFLWTAPAPADEFPLKDGDTWVFAGDSITFQKLHTNYIEAFCYARYPKLTFRFRNSGIGGDTIPKVIARFDYDVAAWKPTIVSVELGMNDKGGFTPEKYIENMGKLTEMIVAVKARPVFITASPVNNGETMAKLMGNGRLHEYAVALKKFAADRKAPYADQFHALIDFWGKNKPREALATTLPGLIDLAKKDNLAGVEDLRKFLEAQAKEGPAVSMLGDPVHPGPTGQLTMAAAILKDLGADGFVSSAELDASGKVTAAKGCTIDGVQAEKETLSFDRTDECLPFPIAAQARPVIPLYSPILDLSQYTLKVTGLKGEQYQLKINNVAVGAVSVKDLEKGINLTMLEKGAIAGQGIAILNAVAAKENAVQTWRAQAKAATAKDAPKEVTEKFEKATKAVEDADAKIREAARPKKLHFELTPMAKAKK